MVKLLLMTVLTGPAVFAAAAVNITVDMSAGGKTITNKFSDINMWMIDRTWLRTAETYPDDYFSANFPFVERVQLMAATGGNEDRDLFKNPNDRTTITDYDFENLITACENILAKGLKPTIKTGWVPLKLSANPHLGEAFQTNLRPPRDYEAYYTYIKAVAEAVKVHFGIETIKDWSWGVGVEYENRDWFEADDGKAESTRLAYFKLYDYTVSALEDALGAENFKVGAHSMSVTIGLWDERDFIEHCATGTNYRTGKQGVKLDYLAVSYYTTVPGFDPITFMRTVERVRQKALQAGLHNLKYGIDEGRVLNGWDGKVIYTREVQHPVQPAGDAKLFHLMVENDVDYFSTWCVTTEGLFGGIPVASTNFRNIALRLSGCELLNTTIAGDSIDATNEVNGLAGFDSGQKTLRLLIYNFCPGQYATTREYSSDRADITLSIANAKSILPEGVTVRTWRLDENNGNWWQTWQADVAARNMQDAAFAYSVWTPNLPAELNNRADRDFWAAREAAYGKAGEMKYQEEQKTINPDGQLGLSTHLEPYGVMLVEIFPVEVADAEIQREDINADGRANILDIISLILLGIKNPADPRADYDGSGTYSVQDAVLLAKNIYDRGHGVVTLPLSLNVCLPGEVPPQVLFCLWKYYEFEIL